MKYTSQNFELVCLHDAKILGIARNGDCITLNLSFAGLLKGHPGNPLATDHLICLNPVLTFCHVQGEEFRTWNDTSRQWDAHRHPECPLDDEVVTSEWDGLNFFLDGFHMDGWSEWRILADGFILKWVHDHPYRAEDGDRQAASADGESGVHGL